MCAWTEEGRQVTAGVLDQVLDQVLAELQGNSCSDTRGVKLKTDLRVQDLIALQICGRLSTDFPALC